MHALHQDERDQNGSGDKAARRRRGKPRSTREKDRFLLTVAVATRLNEVSPAEFQMYCDHAVPED